MKKMTHYINRRSLKRLAVATFVFLFALYLPDEIMSVLEAFPFDAFASDSFRLMTEFYRKS